MAKDETATVQLVTGGPSAATPTSAPAPASPLSPAPTGTIKFMVSRCVYTRTGAQIVTEVDANAVLWSTGSAGTITMTAIDNTLDHLRVGDTLTLVADPRPKA